MNVKKLKDVCDFISGLWTGKKPPYVSVGVIRNTNFHKSGNLDFSDIAQLEVEVKQFSTRQLKFGDIVLEKSGGGPKQPVGRVCVFEKEDGLYSLSNFTSAIRVKNSKELDYKYLHYYLKHLYIAGETEKIQTHSTGIRNLQLSLYKDFLVPLPLLSTQQKIVAKLDAIFVEIDKATKAAEANAKNADSLLNTSIESAFSKLFKEFKSVPLAEVTELSRGHNPPKSKFVYEPKEGYVRFYQIRDGSSDDRAVYVPDSPQLHKVDKDDILMVAYRHVGRAFRGVEGAFNVALCKIKNKNKDILLDDFLFYLIPSSFVRGELLKQSERSLIPSMSITHLKEITIPLPSIQIQKSTVERLKVIEENTLLMKKSYQLKVINHNLLKQEVLKKAFNGELLKE